MYSLLLAFHPPAVAQTIATSPAPSAVTVTVYRAPNRNAGEPMNLRWLNGFALISETRAVTIPAGESDIRFEGVAGGLIPESAIVTNLPGGVVEKNQDAYLLSPASLLDASLGRRVHIRRTWRATGAETETEAVIRSGAGGAVVLETPAGVEALRCSGLPETLLYGRVPAGLSAKPTLSVRVRSATRTRARVTLSYLATGFDWQANYVAELSPDGAHMDLFAWLTLANGDETSFAKADTQAVAGRLSRQGVVRLPQPRPELRLQCWPQGTTTSDLPTFEREEAQEFIVVTGSRIAYSMAPPPPPPPPPAPPPPPMTAQEELGDLKLYRIPEPVTVAAMSQKQVALLRQQAVPVAIVYRHRVQGEGRWGATPVVTARNRTADRLGLPLPSGQIAFFEEHQGRRVLAGRGRLRDLAVGEDVEVALGQATAVLVTIDKTAATKSDAGYRLTVTNAKPYPVRFEAEIESAGREVSADAPLAKRDGRALWAVAVPANGSTSLSYSVGSASR